MTAIVVGRFQVPYLHLGHIYLIATALQQYDQVLIFLGESPQRDENNPYTLQQREIMIRKVFDGKRIAFRALDDVPGNDIVWSWTVDQMLKFWTDPVLLHSRDSFKDHYRGIYPTRELPEIPGYSGTKLREEQKQQL